MKSPHKILHAIQILTFLGLAGVAVLTLIAFNVRLPNLNFLHGAGDAGTSTTVKIPRPQGARNATYQGAQAEGDKAFYRGDFKAALDSYQRAAELEPQESLPVEKIGDVFFAQKNYDSAAQNYQLAYSIEANKISLAIKEVRSLLELRKVLDARAKLDKIQPETQGSLYYQGLISAFLNETDKAKNYLMRSLAAGQDESYQQNAQKILNVYRDYELARGASVEYLQALLAQTFDQIGEYGLSIELAFDALKTQHDYRDVWIVLGHSFLHEEKWLDAEDAFSRAIDLDSGSASAFFFRSIAKKNSKSVPKLTEAIADIAMALKLGWQPKIVAQQELAEIYFDLGKYDQAYPLYKEVVFADPSDVDLFVRPMALAINHLHLPKDAREIAKKAHETHPGTAMAENLLGWAALANGDLTGAHQHLAEALRRDPELAAAYLNSGQLAEAEANRASALSFYQKAMNFAGQSGDSSIGATAKIRYNALAGTSTPLSPISTPQTNSIPSLSLL